MVERWIDEITKELMCFQGKQRVMAVWVESFTRDFRTNSFRVSTMMWYIKCFAKYLPISLVSRVDAGFQIFNLARENYSKSLKHSFCVAVKSDGSRGMKEFWNYTLVYCNCMIFVWNSYLATKNDGFSLINIKIKIWNKEAWMWMKKFLKVFLICN